MTIYSSFVIPLVCPSLLPCARLSSVLISLNKNTFLFKSSGFSTSVAHSQIMCNNSRLPFSSAIYQAGLPC